MIIREDYNNIIKYHKIKIKTNKILKGKLRKRLKDVEIKITNSQKSILKIEKEVLKLNHET